MKIIAAAKTPARSGGTLMTPPVAAIKLKGGAELYLGEDCSLHFDGFEPYDVLEQVFDLYMHVPASNRFTRSVRAKDVKKLASLLEAMLRNLPATAPELHWYSKAFRKDIDTYTTILQQAIVKCEEKM